MLCGVITISVVDGDSGGGGSSVGRPSPCYLCCLVLGTTRDSSMRGLVECRTRRVRAIWKRIDYCCLVMGRLFARVTAARVSVWRGSVIVSAVSPLKNIILRRKDTKEDE